MAPWELTCRVGEGVKGQAGEVRMAGEPRADQGLTDTQQVLKGQGQTRRKGETQKKALQRNKDREMHQGHTEPETPRLTKR